MTTDTLIIGAGLSGLHAASLLHDRGTPFLVLEARPQAGGRIRTVQAAGGAIDLGPSWFWPDLNPRLARLIARLDLPHDAQYTDGEALLEGPDGSVKRERHRKLDPRDPRRLTGGSQALIDALLPTLPEDLLLLSHHVAGITRHDHHLTVAATTPAGPLTFTAGNIILALPPRLLAATITFTPALPPALTDALRATPTWMAGDAKFFALYDEPFWRDDGLSGSAFSETGPLSESHDASLPGGPAALLGFLIPDPRERAALGADLIPRCLAQLGRYFGPAAATPRDTILMDWFHESLTATATDVPLFEHPAYGLPPEARGLWDHRLHFAGTEAAPEHGGYLEGALEAAEAAVAELG